MSCYVLLESTLKSTVHPSPNSMHLKVIWLVISSLNFLYHSLPPAVGCVFNGKRNLITLYTPERYCFALSHINRSSSPVTKWSTKKVAYLRNRAGLQSSYSSISTILVAAATSKNCEKLFDTEISPLIVAMALPPVNSLISHDIVYEVQNYLIIYCILQVGGW